MDSSVYSSPQTREQVLNSYFAEHRARLLDVAAFLDRLDRSRPAADAADFREDAFRAAVKILAEAEPERTRRILLLFSDHSTELPESAHGMKGAAGAVRLATAEGTTP